MQRSLRARCSPLHKLVLTCILGASLANRCRPTMSVPPRVRVCCLLAALALAALLLPGPSRAETRALLVGVSGYPAFPERLRLRGAANDVRLLREVLQERGVAPANIETLADDLPGAGTPSRDGILAGLDRLRAAAKPGDTVMVLLAGHGGRQPPDAQTPADGVGPDGWVKTFLPLDAGRWDGGAVAVERALPGHVLRRALDAITARGAHLFLLVDACHSAALVRGDGGGLRWRSAAGPWTALGGDATGAPQRLPADADTLLGAAADVAPPAALARGQAAVVPGRSALYYAAQADQGTPEVAAGAAGEVHGLFSLTVAQVLRRTQQRGQPISYLQLSQQVMTEYAGRQAARATPLLSGNGLDLLVLGGQPLALRQWALEREDGVLSVAAGALDGLAAGSVLALLPAATARDSEALGYATVGALAPRSARLQPSAHAGRTAPDAAAIAAARMARVVSAPAPVSLSVALDTSRCSTCTLQRAVELLKRAPPPGLALDWTADTARAELTLRQVDRRVQVLTAPVATADISDTLADEWTAGNDPAALAQTLGQRLQAIARVRNLLRLAARLAPPDPTSTPTMLLELQSADGKRRPWPAGSVPRLHHGDVVHVTLHNPSREQGWDLTVLSLDAGHAIDAVYPSASGESPRLPPQGRLVLPGGLQVKTPPSGIARLLLIAVPQRPLREPVSFAFLAQPPAASPRDAIDADLQALFDAVFAPPAGARGTPLGAAPPADLVMQVVAADMRP
jgi:hypothetical protein